MNITPELIHSLESSFIYKDYQHKKQTPYRVKFNGQFITTRSKKTVWSSIGAAKNALINHFRGQYAHSVNNLGKQPYRYYADILPLEFYTQTYSPDSKGLPSDFFSLLIAELEKQKIIEFIPL